jgi:hypothetical protein
MRVSNNRVAADGGPSCWLAAVFGLPASRRRCISRLAKRDALIHMDRVTLGE